MTSNFKISVIVPIMNEEGNLKFLTEKVTNVLQNYSDYELVFIDDGSSDNTLDIIKQQRRENKKIHFLSFSRNFGHQNALRAGFDFASGDCVISMDGDMQHPPELIPKLIEKWLEGFDIVYTKRKDDPKLSFCKRKTAQYFYFLMNKFSDVKIDKGAADFRLMDRKVVEVMRTIKEGNLFMRGMVSWLGFRQFGLQYMPEDRHWGETKYTFGKMMKFAIIGITSFSVKPLHISTMIGYLFATAAFFYGMFAVFMKMFTNTVVSGWTSVLVAILFIGGIQMIMIGILGEYMGKLFIESKGRPNYVIKEKSL